ncbi:host attachment protein [Oceanisphaera psychrotolerans]|uniref:Host cell attachment-required protein n=1 Tax=Oceanisphaera psychrotolerans TaxID=1414654 RepID=A0A1J4QAD6_9GAMM|nr:host attachment protein [Oceanisphaera psychrotolerans]OIN06546.1 host cell attachment-required protein [Oceanisphaera psychrotolerans]
MSDWIVIADASKAVIYLQDRIEGVFEEIMDLAHPEARLKAGDLVSDVQTIPEKSDPRHTENQRFARDIIARIRHALDTNEIRGFYLAAPPQFLGLLRDAMDERLRKALYRDLDKNLSGATHNEVIDAFA